MTREGGDDDPIAGLSIEADIDAIVEGDRDERVDASVALGHVAEDGTLDWAAADESLAHASEVVSTPETRLELVEIAVSEGQEAAEPVADLDAVRARLDDLQDRFDAFTSAVEDLEFPIDWREVQATLNAQRAGLDGAERSGAGEPGGGS